MLKYYKTKVGVITRIYGGQRHRSKKRGHEMPLYSKKELSDWLFSKDLFHILFSKWENSGYDIYAKPSVDRLDDKKGYSFDNIQLMTWGENKDKSNRDRREGKLNSKTSHKSVLQYTKDGKFIAEYISGCEAGRQLGISQSYISLCCRGKYKSVGGYKWKFKGIK